MSRQGTWKSTAVGAALLLALTACGSSDDTPSSSTTAPSSSAASSASGSSSASAPTSAATTSASAVESGSEVDAQSVLGPMNEALSSKKSVKGTLTGGTAGSGVLEISFEEGKRGMRMTLDIQGQEAKVLVTEDAIYMQSDQFASIPGAAGKWVKMGASTSGGLGDIEELSPDKMFENVEKVVYLGDEDVDGRATKHYRVTAKADIPSATGTSTATASPSSVSETAEVWIDSETNLPVKMTADDMGTMTFSDWDVPIDLSAPAASEVLDLENLGGMPTAPVAS